MTVAQTHKWQELLTLGNRFYKSNDLQQAEYHYELAFVLLLEGCQSKPSDCETLMAWICTCHNLSTLFENQNKLPAAMRYLLLPHEHCKHILAEHCADEDAKSLAIQAMSVTLPPIVEFSNNHPHMTNKNSLVNQASSIVTNSLLH